MKKYLKHICAFFILLLLLVLFFVAFDYGIKDGNNLPVKDNSENSGDIYFETIPSFYEKQVNVVIKTNKECTIYYTLDGNVPGESLDLSKCSIYEETGIKLKATGSKVNVYSVTARPIYSDGTMGECIFNTYAVGNNIEERFTNLTVFITCDPDKLFGYENGILVEGKLRDDWIRENPNEKVIAISPAGYNQRGWASEREVNVQMFTPNGVQVINQTAGVRPFGAYSRASILKSLKIYARTEYDEINNKFSFPLFGEHYAYDNSGRLITEYKRLVLRSSGSDLKGSHMRDELHQTLAFQAGFPGAQSVEPISVFLNGEYYGSMWAHDVISDKWFEQHYGAYSGTMAVASGPEREKPDSRYENDTLEEDQYFYDDWNDIYDTFKVLDMTDDEVFENFCSRVDVDNYLFYYAINVYINNNDWPNNNHKAYRYYTAEGEEYKEGTIFDGKWRFLVHDMDWIWGADKDVLNVNLLTKSTRSKLFKALMERDDCVEKFIDYCMELMNGAFSTENYTATIDKMHEERLTELRYYKNESRFSNTPLLNILGGVEENRIYARKRPATLITDLKKAFGVSGNTYTVTINDVENCYITAGNWKIYDKFDGKYLVEYGETFVCCPMVGYEFSHWTVNGVEVYNPELYISEEYRNNNSNIELTVSVTEKKNMPLTVLEYSSEGSDDYIVLYNPSKSEAVSTYGYSLSDTSKKVGKYMLPARIIEPQGKVVIYCDNYSGSEKYHQMAVPFNLKEGETLYLSDNKEIIEEVTLMELHEGYKAVRNLFDNKFYEKAK